ncbi:hypothetical protein AXF42_Ash013752 [Apostasia shenzhenica]|uniref:Uncharacterized protein n=1 Tax=Apostasia shenzhenica TaxID=1088818 RepID=A0A2I0A4R7_9ASPA|nr:hypothetical protein AXF42_Ash013752 [Apostasia shenzhenica]
MPAANAILASDTRPSLLHAAAPINARRLVSFFAAQLTTLPEKRVTRAHQLESLASLASLLLGLIIYYLNFFD